MMSKSFWCGVVLAIAPIIAGSQTTVGVNPVYRRAQTLVNDGNTVAGRVLVDSMIAIAAPGSNDYAEGVYWRAVLAATAADAEMDYRRLAVDYPQSPRVDDALIRLAQLEIARGNYDGALRHLNRLATEHPESSARARAGYWTARALFDKNDVRGGCVATADALTRTGEDEAELRNQINYLNQRCAGVVLTTSAPAPVSTTDASTATAMAPPINPPVAATPPVATTQDTTTKAQVLIAPPTSTPEPAPVKQSSQPVKTSPKPPTRPLDASPSMVEAPREVPPMTSTASEKGGRFSVQVAAYNAKSQADALVAKLKKRGYEARVDGEAAPFRVRVGRYATQTQATAVQRSLKAKQIEGFVVQANTQ